MAFGQNIQQNFGQTISTLPDAQESFKVQTALQERFDVNSAKIDEAIQRISAVPLTREKDKEYFRNKLNNALNQVNTTLKATGGRALLSNNMSGQLTKVVGATLDDYILDKLSIAQEKQQFDTNVAKLKEKDIKSFNQDNYEFALDQVGWEDFQSGKTDSLKGSFSYVPYQDVTANVTEKVKKMFDARGGSYKVQVRDGQGGIVEREIKGMTTEEILKAMPEILSDQDMQQIRINGHMSAKRNPNAVQASFNAIVDDNIQSIQDQLTINQAAVNDSTKTQEQREQAQKNIEYLEQNLQLQNQYKGIKDLPTMGFVVEESITKRTLTDLLKGNESITYLEDKVYANNMDMLLKAKEAEEKALKEKALPEGSFDVTTQEEQEPTGVEAYSKVQRTADNAIREINTKATNLLEDSTMDSTQKAVFRNNLKRQGYTTRVGQNGGIEILEDPTFKGQRNKTRTDAIYEATIASGMLRGEAETEFSKQYQIQKQMQTYLQEANKEFSEDVDTDNLVEVLRQSKEALGGLGARRTIAEMVQAFDIKEWGENIATNISPFVNEGTKSSKNRAVLAKKMANFIESNGGIEALKVKAKTSPELAQQIVSILDEVSDASAVIAKYAYQGGDLTRNLNKAGDKLKAMGALPSTQNRNNIQVTSKEAKQKLINQIDQTLITEGESFDADQPLTAKPNYNTNGVIESFTLFQKNPKLGRDGDDYIQKPLGVATVAASSLAGKTLMSTLNLNSNLNAQGVPKTFELTPVKKVIENPFPTTKTQTELEKDNLIGYNLHTATSPEIQSLLRIYNPDTNFGNAKQNALAYMKSELLGQYTEQEIEQLYGNIESKMKSGAIKVRLIPNKMVNSGIFKWSTEVKDGSTIITKDFTNTAELPKEYEQFFMAYPQLLILQNMTQYYKKQ